MSVKTFWVQALGVVGGHRRLLGWWWLSGLSRVMVGVLGLMVVVSVVVGVFGGGIAGVLALWARRGDVLGDVWLSVGVGGVLAVGSVLNVALAAFFDAGFYGYISNVLVKGEQGTWGVLWGEGIKHWRVMVGWSARRLWWRSVMGMLVFVLGSALLNAGAAGAEGGSVGGGGGKIASLWALAALCLGALGFGVWMWRVRTAKRMLEGEPTTWAGQRAAASDVLRYKAEMLGGFGQLVVAMSPVFVLLLLLAALVGQVQLVWPSGGFAMALMLDLGLVGLVGLVDVLASVMWMSKKGEGSELGETSEETTGDHAKKAEAAARQWRAPLPENPANIFKIRELVTVDLSRDGGQRIERPSSAQAGGERGEGEEGA